jgi:hypothetical protein
MNSGHESGKFSKTGSRSGRSARLVPRVFAAAVPGQRKYRDPECVI